METALKLLATTARAAVDAPASEADLRPLAALLARATTSILDAYDVRREPVTALQDATTACDEAIAELERVKLKDQGLEGVSEWVRAARGWLAVPEQVFARTRAVPPPAREIVASKDTPTLHRIDRRSIGPVWQVAAPLPAAVNVVPLSEELAKLPSKERLATLKERAKTMREEAAQRRDQRERDREARREARRAEEATAPRPGYTKGKHAPLTLEHFHRNKARELFEDVAAMGMQRTPLLGDYWRGSVVFDQRMLRNIDAIAAFGDLALQSLEPLVIGAPAKDPSRAFAIAMALGSFEGRDALASIDRVVRFLGPADPEVSKNLAMGLKLAPHPDLATMLRQWLGDTDEGLRAIAIDVLGHRGLATPEELTKACRDESEIVAARAFVPAALAQVPEIGVLIEERKEAKDPDLVDALAWATALGGVAYASDRLRKRIAEPEGERVLLPIALAGEKDDAAELLSRFERAPTRALAIALGYAGLPASLDPLVDALDREIAPETKQDIAFSLQRITGAELYDDVDVAADVRDVEEPANPPLPDDAPPLRRMSVDRRDRPGEGAADRVKLPTMRAEAWRAFLAEDSVKWQGDRRLRRGKPYTPALSLEELDSYQITPPERRILYREIIIKTGRHIPFDPVDFVAVQEEALKKLAPIVQTASSVPGAWGRALRK
ncbi:MAG: hypothetical protein HOW73_16070 [Polyangiaceae bacterium]|nr:hypothetical protein [Polyangiaceae bacterium]